VKALKGLLACTRNFTTNRRGDARRSFTSESVATSSLIFFRGVEPVKLVEFGL
jgi:hypothetical protein